MTNAALAELSENPQKKLAADLKQLSLDDQLSQRPKALDSTTLLPLPEASSHKPTTSRWTQTEPATDWLHPDGPRCCAGVGHRREHIGSGRVPVSKAPVFAYRRPADPAGKACLGLAFSEEGITQIFSSIKEP
jgi:hypothetical protein